MAHFWMIEESVGGFYITHPGIYETRAAAEAEAAKFPRARAAMYRTGQAGKGPERAEAGDV